MSSVRSQVGSIIDDIISNVVEQSSESVESGVEADVDLVIDDIISKIESADRSRKMVAYQGAATVAASREVVAAFQAGSRWMGKVTGALRSPVFKMPSFKAPDVEGMCDMVCDAATSASSAASSASAGFQELRNRKQESWQINAIVTSLYDLEKRIRTFDVDSEDACLLVDINPLINRINISKKYSKLVDAYLSKTGSSTQNLIKDLDKLWDAKYITRDEVVERVLNLPSHDKLSQDRRNSLYKISIRCDNPAEIFLYWTDKVSQLLADVESKTISSDATYWKMRLSIEIIRNCLLPLSQKNLKSGNKDYNLIPKFIDKNFVLLDKNLIKFRERGADGLVDFNDFVRTFNEEFSSCADSVYRSLASIDQSGVEVVSEEEKRRLAKELELKAAEEKRKIEAFQKSHAEAAAEQLKKDEARKQEEATEEARKARKEQAKQKAIAKALRNDLRLQRIDFWGEWQKSRLLSSNLAGVVDIPQHINHKRDEFENLAKINWQSFLYRENDFKVDSLADPINEMDKVRSNYLNLREEIRSLQEFVNEQKHNLSARWQVAKIDTKSAFKVYERALENMQVSLDKAYKHTVSKQHDLLSPVIMGAVSGCYNDIVETLEQKDLKERDFVDISKEMQTDIAKFSSFNEKLSQAHDEFFFHDDICQQAWMAYLDVLNMQYRIRFSSQAYLSADNSGKGEVYIKFYDYFSRLPQVADLNIFEDDKFKAMYKNYIKSYSELDATLNESQNIQRLNILKYEGDSAQFSIGNLMDKYGSRYSEIMSLQHAATRIWVNFKKMLKSIEEKKKESIEPEILEKYINATRKNLFQQANAYKRLTDSFIFVDPCANTSLSRDASSPISSDDDNAIPHALFDDVCEHTRPTEIVPAPVVSSINSGNIEVGIVMPEAREQDLPARQGALAAINKNKGNILTAALFIGGAVAIAFAPQITIGGLAIAVACLGVVSLLLSAKRCLHNTCRPFGNFQGSGSGAEAQPQV